MNKYNIFVKILLDRISKPSVGIDGFAFSKNIVRKYDIFRNSGRLPSLIFLRLFGRRNVNRKINLNNQIFINNFVKSFYMQYPDVFRQHYSYFQILDKNTSDEAANISMLEQSGIVNNIIKNTISHEHITNKHYEGGDAKSFPILTEAVRSPGITLHSFNPIASNYLQRFINIRNIGHKFNKLIYPEMQYFTDENHFLRLLQLIKKNRPIVDKNTSQQTANISIPSQDGIANNNIDNTISHEYITNKYHEAGDERSFPLSTTTVRSPGITLHSFNPITNNYLQRFINIRNASPEFNQAIYPEIQYFTDENHFLRLLHLIKKNRPITYKNIPQNTANISILNQGGIFNNNIDNTISHEYITNKYHEAGDERSFPLSTTTVKSPGITLLSFNPITNNYLQRFFNIRNASPEFNQAIYPEIHYFTDENHFLRLLQLIKKNRPITYKNIPQNTANISIPSQGGIVNNNIENTISHEYITNKYHEAGDERSFPISTTTVRSPGNTLHSFNPITNNYLQRFINIRNASPEFNQAIYPEIQYFNNEDHVFKFLEIIKQNRLIVDKNISQDTTNISIPSQGGIVNNNINNTIPHEHITNKYYESGDARLFPISSTTTGPSGITANSINTIVSNYLQRFINIRNTGPTFNKSIYPEIQYFTNENNIFKLLQTIKKNRSIVDKDISQKTANISNSQQSRIVNNTRLYDHIIKKSSKIINYFQEINNINNIGSKANHPLIYGLHPSFNEEELFNKKIFPIQDVDLTYASEPVLNIPTSQNKDVVQEKIENIPVRSINSTGINESLINESSQHKSVHEIHMIADKVYKIIEKKISVEKDRRGLF